MTQSNATITFLETGSYNSVSLAGKVAINHDGSYIALHPHRSKKTIQIIPRTTYQTETTINLDSEKSAVDSLSMNPSGTHVIAIFQNGAIKEWDAKTGKLLCTLQEATGQSDEPTRTPLIWNEQHGVIAFGRGNQLVLHHAYGSLISARNHVSGQDR
jgi:WD40 repeat protein